jgi:hypothetical protein
MNFLLWRSQLREGFCVIKSPAIEHIWELDDGISRISDFPADASCRMDPKFPRDIQLSDNLYGADVPVISRKLKEILEKEVLHNKVEYLPVRIINHKGRVASKDYFILHPLDVCDCIDVEKSGVLWNQITSDLISGCSSLVLKDEAIPDEYKLFRLKYWGYNILVRRDLVDTLNTAGLTDLVFRETAGYTGLG